MPVTFEIMSAVGGLLDGMEEPAPWVNSGTLLRITTELLIADDLELVTTISRYLGPTLTSRSIGPQRPWFCSPLLRLAGRLASVALPVGIRFEETSADGRYIREYSFRFLNPSSDREYVSCELHILNEDVRRGKVLRADLVRDLVGTTATYLSLNRHSPRLSHAVVKRFERVLETLRLSRDIVLTPEQELKYDILREWRATKSSNRDRSNLYAYDIGRNKVLRSLVRLHVREVGDLELVKGLTYDNVSRYGEEIVVILNSVEQAKPYSGLSKIDALIQSSAYQKYLDSLDAESTMKHIGPQGGSER